MGLKTDADQATAILRKTFESTLSSYLKTESPVSPNGTKDAVDALFTSSVQSFREALVGCILAKMCKQQADVTLPYAGQGDLAFNGRQIDEEIVNPFFQENRIPCSKGPYLAVFRRNVQFTAAIREGLRDKKACDAFLLLVDFVNQNKQAQIKELLRFLLWNFIALREQGDVEISRIHRLSLDQYSKAVEGLLTVPSGGLLPVLLSVSMFYTLKDCFKLPWKIEFQGINAADKASEVSGDITIQQDAKVILAIEITERVIDKNRVVSTFNTKIAPTGLGDYLFLYTKNQPEGEARQAAFQYFGQGHDVSFLSVKDWITSCLGTVGASCRAKFTEYLIQFLDQKTVPVRVKLAWNKIVADLVG